VDEIQAGLARVTHALPGGGSERPGQLRMAQAVALAIKERRHLIVQAGTGTGKTLAYLLPALLSGSRIVVATATKALQDQLARNDLPLLQQHLGVPFTYTVLKGRSNYLCRQRALEVAGGGDQLDLSGAAEAPGEDGATLGAFGREVRRLLEWATTATSGDRADLSFEPKPRAWAMVSVSSLECPGAAKCPAGDVCFAEKARDEAAKADVIVVNTHLYAMHLASGGNIIPAHDVIIFDEAHELEDIAGASLGLEMHGGRFHALARNAKALVDDASLLDHIDDAGQRLTVALGERDRRDRRLPSPLEEELANLLIMARERVARLTAAIRKHDGDRHTELRARKARAQQAAGHLAGDLDYILSMPETHVAWVEGPAHAPTLKLAPIEVGPLLNTLLWTGEEAPTGILTSATIPPRLAERIGLPEASHTEEDVGSPFDYPHQALLYCAVHLPDPRSPDYEPAMHTELEHLIKAAGGRTLALFTSWRAMEAAAASLRPHLPYPLLTQAELPKPALVERFRTDEHSCLFATMGFWQGVDVPGPALSLVVLDRIPFPRPDEPLLQARRDRLGRAAFGLVDLPRAATLLAQGAGRLIRTTTDRGVVAVLDPRLATARYRWDLVRALPDMKRTRNRNDVEDFFRSRDGSRPEDAVASPYPP
jgi:ATP-dependent DNA helicase DinG